MKKISILFIFLLTIFLLSSCKKEYKTDEFYNSNPNQFLDEGFSNEEYRNVEENPIKDVITSPLSTFSIDVDTASYSNMRRYLKDGLLPPKGAIRTEELVNYFTYEYPDPVEGYPLSIITEVAPCPWNDKRNLAMVVIQGIKISTEEMPETNLVFLLDVSGSMNYENKLPLVKQAMKLLVNNLRKEDKISIVVYAGAAGVVLEPTSGENKDEIIQAIDRLEAGGSTAGGAGIQLAYSLAKENFIEGGNNRVILATDGDFNVGVSSESELVSLIEEKRNDDIYLSVLGFGTGNYKDAKMETLADKGNGNYAYIDTLMEAKKVLIEQMGSTLLTIAKDVKIQIEFNPTNIKGYRLIGYENRLLNNEDFNDDNKDAGEIGAGFTVTAFYEIIPTSSDEVIPGVDDLKYQQRESTNVEDLFTFKLRYKEPTQDESKLIEKVVKVIDITNNPSDNFTFASSVVEFSLLLRNSQYQGNASFEHVLNNANLAKGVDIAGYRTEFISLVQTAKELSEE